MKTCIVCSTNKELDQFSPREGMRDGRRNECKACMAAKQRAFARTEEGKARKNERGREWYRAHPEEAKARGHEFRLRTRYKITAIEYDRMYQVQGGRCAICGVHQTELPKRLCVDHNHATMAVRGLLCDRCNHVLGHARENVAILEKSITYLNENDRQTVPEAA